METKELRPFNLDEAKRGNEVCTSDGQKVQLLCFNAPGARHLVGYVMTDRSCDVVATTWDESGEGLFKPFNLMMR